MFVCDLMCFFFLSRHGEFLLQALYYQCAVRRYVCISDIKGVLVFRGKSSSNYVQKLQE
jgi:hypothetical protein